MPKKSHPKRFAFLSVGVLSILVIFVIAAIFLSTIFSYDKKHPTDSDLEVTFSKHEKDFDRLIQMSKTDSKVIRIANTFTWLDDNVSWPRPDSELGFSKERWDEYNRIFSELDLDAGLLQYPNAGVFYLIASSGGLVTGGSAKGYAYSEHDLSPIYDSLDNFVGHNTHGKPVYKKLTTNWYLYYESN